MLRLKALHTAANPMTKVKMAEAQQRLPELVADAVGGEEVIIERGDGANVRLVPVPAATALRTGGGLKGVLVVPDDFDEPLPDLEAYT